jgi:hypothetical protein
MDAPAGKSRCLGPPLTTEGKRNDLVTPSSNALGRSCSSQMPSAS